MPNVLNTNETATHIFHQGHQEGITLKPGVNEISESNLEKFGELLEAQGVQLVEELNEPAPKPEKSGRGGRGKQKEQQENEPEMTPDKEEKQLEAMNDTAESKPEGSEPANEEGKDKLENLSE